MEEIILYCELDGTQSGFSALMQIIQAFETDDTDVAYEYILEKISIKYCWFKEGRPKIHPKEAVKLLEENTFTKEGTGSWRTNKLTELREMVKRKKNYQFSYYVRICNNRDEDIKNMQYMLLIFQQYSVICGRIQVFLEPFEKYLRTPKESWKGISVYYKYSHYMRFVLRNYKQIFFSAFYSTKDNRVCVAPLSSKRVGVQSTFFPLLEIDNEIHTAITQYCMLEADGTLSKKEHFESSRLKELFEISTRILEHRLSENINDIKSRKEFKVSIYNMLSKERITSLEYAVFSVLVPISPGISEIELAGYKKRARSISSGLVQLVENIILHSLNHVGVFTFRIISKEKRYLDNIFKDKQENPPSILEIDIADANTYETMLDNFLKKVEDKEKYFENVNLAVSHFFHEYEQNDVAKNAWGEFRKENPVKCLGLERLNLEIEQSKAIFQVRSNNHYYGDKADLSYMKNYYNDATFRNMEERAFIPGTQFVIIIPMVREEIETQHNANLFMYGLGNLSEKDISYANYISYQSEAFEQCRGADLLVLDRLFYNECTKGVLKDSAKDQMVDKWRSELNVWESKILSEQEIVYYFDFCYGGNIASPWGIETFCKALVDSKVLHGGKIKYVALINCTDYMMKMLFETIMLSDNYDLGGTQLYLHCSDYLNDLVLAGSNKKEIILNALQYTFAKGEPPEYLKKYMVEVKVDRKEMKTCVELFPFDVVLRVKKYDEVTLFEKYIEEIAQLPLTAMNKAGYLVEKAHMRLGNKVHLKEFYEISILFRKPRIARKIALLIIRRMLEEKLDINRNLLFYGYASYSKPILTALVEIIKCYQNCKYFVEFVVYQNDIMVQKTLTHISPKVRMYYSQEMPSDMKIDIVQIVPISSTLTTFKKMWDMFTEEKPEKMENRTLLKNYTLFWVRDFQNSENMNKPTDIEKEYWSEICGERSIKTSLISPYPQFFCYKHIHWFNPLNCEQCYPKNILDEIPLVETDVTSTVPSQQLEINLSNEEDATQDGKRVICINEIRLIHLRNCIYYGHISRDGNHFQYYIDTVQYFHKQKKYIANWLINLQKYNQEGYKNWVNVIVTPQHHTNVEFTNYVNNYYFNGCAEVITIDSAKEYRSNIILKYGDIKSAIVKALECGVKVKFIYVDDTIITGSTYRRVNNLLHSLVPSNIQNPIQFEQVFVLVNRLSYHSKMDYVENVKEFHSFVDINISSVRNYGDSCAMCTLQKNSVLFFKRSSTAGLSAYWNIKKYEYKAISFDKYLQSPDSELRMQQGYTRMLCSHYAKENLKIGIDSENNILSIVNMFLKVEAIMKQSIQQVEPLETEQNIQFFLSEELSPIYSCIFKEEPLQIIKAFLKVLCRPFFSYGKMYKGAITDLLLLLSESFLNPEFDENLVKMDTKLSANKRYLNKNRIREEVAHLIRFIKSIIPTDEQRQFVLDYLLEGLTDLRSNYIIRKNTFNYFKYFVSESPAVKEYYRKLERMIHRLINSSADETKSLWLEYLLITGEENETSVNEDMVLSLRKPEEDNNFNLFWDSLLIENTRLYYDSMLNFVKRASESKKGKGTDAKEIVDEAVEEMWDDYYIINLRRFIGLEMAVESEEHNATYVKDKVKRLAHLLYCLKNEKRGAIDCYTDLKQYIESVLYDGDKVLILTKAHNTEEGGGELCAVTDYNKAVSVPRDIVKHVDEAMDNDIKNKSYYVGNNYVVLCINNNKDILEEKGIKDIIVGIQPLYFYIRCDTSNHFRVILRIRKILMYRHQLLHWIEADFNNNMMPILVDQMGINKQLRRDRAGDHNNSTDILMVETLLQSKFELENIEVYRWLLLKVYVNIRISRLFRCEWSKLDNEIIDKVYTLDKNYDSINKPFKNLKNTIFGETLKDLKPDNYFKLIKDLFQFDLEILGERKENVNSEDLKDILKKVHGRCEGGYYYKQEYILCILLDILFNAMKTCKRWDMHLHEYARKIKPENYNHISMKDENIRKYYILKDSKEKCKVKISVEESCIAGIAYLVIKNKVCEVIKEDINKKNNELTEKILSKETSGISIQAMKWYTENLSQSKKPEALFSYEWNKIDKIVEFVTKLPIIKLEVNNENLLH